MRIQISSSASSGFHAGFKPALISIAINDASESFDAFVFLADCLTHCLLIFHELLLMLSLQFLETVTVFCLQLR